MRFWCCTLTVSGALYRYCSVAVLVLYLSRVGGALSRYSYCPSTAVLLYLRYTDIRRVLVRRFSNVVPVLYRCCADGTHDGIGAAILVELPLGCSGCPGCSGNPGKVGDPRKSPPSRQKVGSPKDLSVFGPTELGFGRESMAPASVHATEPSFVEIRFRRVKTPPRAPIPAQIRVGRDRRTDASPQVGAESLRAIAALQFRTSVDVARN